MNINNVLPAKARKYVYLALVLLGLASGAIAVGYSSLSLPLPAWYIAGAAVLAFVSAAPATLALLNINSGDPLLAQPDPDEPGAEYPDDSSDGDDDPESVDPEVVLTPTDEAPKES